MTGAVHASARLGGGDRNCVASDSECCRAATSICTHTHFAFCEQTPNRQRWLLTGHLYEQRCCTPVYERRAYWLPRTDLRSGMNPLGNYVCTPVSLGHLEREQDAIICDLYAAPVMINLSSCQLPPTATRINQRVRFKISMLLSIDHSDSL